MTAEKPTENNNDPTCDETVEVSNGDSNRKENSKEGEAAPSPGPLLRRQQGRNSKEKFQFQLTFQLSLLSLCST